MLATGLVGACLAQAPAGAQAGTAPDALSGLRTAWVQSLEQHDLEAAVGLFEPDAVFLSAEGSRFPDRAAIRTLYRSVFNLYRATITMSSRKQDCSGALCVDSGSYSEAITETGTGKKLAASGNYVLVARREGAQTQGGGAPSKQAKAGGQWKIVELAFIGGGPTPAH